jgi:hypothetical protein
MAVAEGAEEVALIMIFPIRLFLHAEANILQFPKHLLFP